MAQQVIRLLFEIISPRTTTSLACLFASFLPFSFSFVRIFSFLTPGTVLRPLKWQSFLRRRPLKVKRDERRSMAFVASEAFIYLAVSGRSFIRMNESSPACFASFLSTFLFETFFVNYLFNSDPRGNRAVELCIIYTNLKSFQCFLNKKLADNDQQARGKKERGRNLIYRSS